MPLDTTFFSQHYQQRWASTSIPSWSADSYTRFLSRGLPTRKSEAWRYAKLDQWFSPQRQHACMAGDLVAYPESVHDADIVMSNGKLIINNVDLDLIVISMQEAIHTHADIVNRHMRDFLSHDRLDNPLAQYAAAAWQDGFFIQVPSGYRHQAPLRIVYDYSSGTFSNLVQIIDMGVGSKLTLLEKSYGATGLPYIHNAVTSIQLAAGAELVNERVQMASDDAVWHDCRLIQQHSTSKCTQRVFTLGAQHAREESLVDFLGEQAEHHFSGVGFASPQAEHAAQVMMLHRMHHCRSNQQYRSLVAQRAENSFLGHIVVPKDVQATTAYQDSKSLLLDALARANVKPYLEIFADDVVCTHSASVGQLDKKALFYLQARGMTAAQAYAILLDAFVQEILVTGVDDGIKHIVAEAVEERSRMIFGEATL